MLTPALTPERFRHVSQGQLSPAIRAGGCFWNGKVYVYVPQTDELVRADVLARERARQKPGRQP